jgi:NADH-quinone oxidoreductase subunit M
LELLIIPLVLSIIACFLPKQSLKFFSLIGVSISLVISLVHVFSYCGSAEYVSILDPNHITNFGLSFKMGYDGMSLFMVLLTNLILLLILLANFNRDLAQSKKFTSMVFLMQFALIGVFTAMDGILFYVFWEITLIPIFLIALWYGAQDRKKILLKFFIYTFIGSLAMLFALITIKMYAVTFAHSDLMAAQLSTEIAFWVMGGFFLAFAIKAPIFPFHTWQPDTYTVAPMAGTILLSALMLKMALYGMIRWMIPLAPEGLDSMQYPIIILALIGIVYTAILAIKQADIKRIFAFASISHVGLIAAGIMIFTKDSLNASFLQMLNHSLVALGLFLCAGILEDRLKTRNIYEMGGIAKNAPKFGFWFAIIGFASVSVPFSSGFIGEFLLLKELYTYQWLIGLLAGTTLVFGAVYTLRAYQISMFGPTKHESFIDLTWNEWLTLVIVGILILALGLFPQVIFDFVGPSIDKLMESVELSKNLVK